LGEFCEKSPKMLPDHFLPKIKTNFYCGNTYPNYLVYSVT
jgi:hypothetical protein